jgi:hypothetical protein
LPRNKDIISPGIFILLSNPGHIHVDIIIVTIATADQVFPILVSVCLRISGIFKVALIKGCVTVKGSTTLTFQNLTVSHRGPLAT